MEIKEIRQNLRKGCRKNTKTPGKKSSSRAYATLAKKWILNHQGLIFYQKRIHLNKFQLKIQILRKNDSGVT